MKKKILIIIVTLIIILAAITTLFICYKKGYIFSSNEEDDFSYMPLTYEICDEDSCIYLLGSIHVGDSRVNKFDSKLIDLYNKSDSLTVELDTKTVTLNINDFMMNSLETIDDILTEEEQEKLTEFLKDKNALSYDLLKFFKIGYISNYLSLLPIMELELTGSGVDEYFITLAHNENKEIIELETYEDQLSLLLDYSDEFYISQINDVIENYDYSVESLRNLYESYLKANKNELENLINESNTQAELTEEERNYNEEILTKRNIKMSNKIEEFLKENKGTFMIVGLAHIIGENGIIDILESNNYKINLIK